MGWKFCRRMALATAALFCLTRTALAAETTLIFATTNPAQAHVSLVTRQ